MAVEFNYAKLGARIRKKRRELGLSQEMLAEKASLTKAHISHIENSYSKPSVQTLFQIAHAWNDFKVCMGDVQNLLR